MIPSMKHLNSTSSLSSVMGVAAACNPRELEHTVDQIAQAASLVRTRKFETFVCLIWRCKKSSDALFAMSLDETKSWPWLLIIKLVISLFFSNKSTDLLSFYMFVTFIIIIITPFCHIIKILRYSHLYRDTRAYILDPCIREFS